MQKRTIISSCIVGVLLLFTSSTALAQIATDKFELDDIYVFTVVRTFDVPGVSYISQAGIDYYHRQESPISEYLNLHIELRGMEPNVDIVALVYNDGSVAFESATEVYALVGEESGSPYLNGKIYFFTFLDNPDEGSSSQLVHRIAALGLTANNEFGFFRVIDTFGQYDPDVVITADVFQIWSSPATLEHMESPKAYGPYYFKELVVEAGSPAALGGGGVVQVGEKRR